MCICSVVDCSLKRRAGNQFIAQLTATPSTKWILHVDMTDFVAAYEWAEYNNFVLGPAATNYKLASLGTYSENSSKSNRN